MLVIALDEGPHTRFHPARVKMIMKAVRKNLRTTMWDLMNELQRAEANGRKATISITLHRGGFKSCSARGVPLLKQVHLQAQRKFAREIMDDPKEDWENIIWSDETKATFP